MPTYPHHKHISSNVEPAEPPDLGEVLREIDRLLYKTKPTDALAVVQK
ncbi:MAG: hypothetical protein ACE5H9_11415 [Anaerolineae bacterium]